MITMQWVSHLRQPGSLADQIPFQDMLTTAREAMPHIPVHIPDSALQLVDGDTRAVLTERAWPHVFDQLHELELKVRGAYFP